MRSNYSQELVAPLSDFTEPASAPLHSVSGTPSAGAFSESTGRKLHALKTCEHSAPKICEELPSISSAADSPARDSARRPGDGVLPQTYGQSNSDLSKPSDLPLSLPKTSRKRQSPTRLVISKEQAIARTTDVYRRLIAGQTIREIVGGYVHTPTRKANFVAPSMQKWPSCRRFVAAFGGREITPEQFEFLMGLPIGWTELGQSETDKSRRSQKLSGGRS